MQVTRFENAEAYEAPKHFDVHGLRLQGFEATDTDNVWMGLSNFLPGGGAESDAGPIEKIYFMVEGEMTVTTDEGDTVIRKFDSCHIGAGETRSIKNNTNLPALMLVVMPYPEAK